jgi:hypothetical protein
MDLATQFGFNVHTKKDQPHDFNDYKDPEH